MFSRAPVAVSSIKICWQRGAGNRGCDNECQWDVSFLDGSWLQLFPFPCFKSLCFILLPYPDMPIFLAIYIFFNRFPFFGQIRQSCIVLHKVTNPDWYFKCSNWEINFIAVQKRKHSISRIITKPKEDVGFKWFLQDVYG